MSSIFPVGRDEVTLAKGGSQATRNEPGGSEFLSLLRRHSLLIVLCVLAAAALAEAYTLLAKPVYQANSVVRFEQDEVNLPQLVQTLATENRISTEIEVVQDRSAAVDVIDSLGLRAQLISPYNSRRSELFTQLRVAPSADTSTLLIRSDRPGHFIIWRPSDRHSAISANVGDTVQIAGVTLSLSPRAKQHQGLRLQVISLAAAVRAFQSSLKVSRPSRDADLINLQVQGSDPAEISSAANLLAEQLISGRQEVEMERTASTVGFLTKQLDTLGSQLHSAEDELSGYRRRAGVVDAPTAARTQVSRLVQVQADRGALEAERDALAMLVTQMRSDSAKEPLGAEAPASRLMSFPTLFKNQATAQLLASLGTVEDARAALLVRRTPEDPDVLALTARIHEINGQLQVIAETYLQGLSNQVAGLDAVAARFGTSLDSLPQEEVQTARLERGVSVLQDLYTLIQTRLKEAEITQAMKDPALRIVDPAVIPDKPVRPRPLVNLAIALILGTIVGLTAALLREITNRSVRSRADAFSTTGLPVVGAIPRIEAHSRFNSGGRTRQSRIKGPRFGALIVDVGQAENKPRTESNEAAVRIASKLVTRAEVSAAYAESFSQLHINLTLAHRDLPLKSIVFTSPLPGEGKTLSAINFALTVAARGLRVLLIDADLRRGLVNEVFRSPRVPGFAEILRGTARFEDAARRVMFGEGNSLMILASGARLPTPGRLQTTDRVREVLNALTPQFDLIIIDSPPVNLLADAALLGSAADGVLLIVRAGHTRTDALRYAVEQLSAAQAPIVGTLLNDIDLRRHVGDDGSYRYLAEVDQYYSMDA